MHTHHGEEGKETKLQFNATSKLTTLQPFRPLYFVKLWSSKSLCFVTCSSHFLLWLFSHNIKNQVLEEDSKAAQYLLMCTRYNRVKQNPLLWILRWFQMYYVMVNIVWNLLKTKLSHAFLILLLGFTRFSQHLWGWFSQYVV